MSRPEHLAPPEIVSTQFYIILTVFIIDILFNLYIYLFLVLQFRRSKKIYTKVRFNKCFPIYFVLIIHFQFSYD